MKFVCDRCQTKYSIADERVRGKVLKVKCKTCANLITVREARGPSSAGLPTLSAAAAARPRTGANAALNIPTETPGVDSERTQLAQSPYGPEPDPFPDLGGLAPARRPTGQMQAVAPIDDGVQWYMALDGNRTGPFTRSKLVDKLMPLAKNADVHIWNERLDGWKPPSGVPEIAGEITRRRAPPPPPPLPGAPRRPTPPPMPPLAGLAGPPHGQPARRPTGSHAPPSPTGHGSGPVGSKLPPPGGVHPALAARGVHEHGDPSSMLETPAPMPHQLPRTGKTNGVGASGTHAPPRPVSSDVMQMLNLPGGTETPGAPPKLMSLTGMMAMGAGTTVAPAPRSKSAVYVLALLGVVAAVVVAVTVTLKKPPRAPTVVVAPPPPPAPDPVVQEPQETPPPPEPPVEPPANQHGKPTKLHGKPGKAIGNNSKPPPGTTTPPAPPANSDLARFRDNHNMNITGGGGPRLPPPAQADITKVISNNRAGIKICYQRALTRDNSLTHGKLSVKLSIGISGRVKHVGLDGPMQFRTLLEPCIKEVVQRWVFPQSSEEYGTEFPLVFQGNE